MSSDELRAMFFAEGEELLDAMNDGLHQMEAGESDEEVLNAVFRAIHSIKGTAGAFGFDKLAGFTHRFETVLDRLRGGEIELEDTLMGVLLRSGDILADLLELARDDDETEPETMQAVLAELAGFCDADEVSAETDGEGGDLVFEPMGLDPVAFDPVGLDSSAPGLPEPGLTGPDSPPTQAAGQTGRWRIEFDPGPGFFRSGHEAHRLFAALAELGPLEVTARASLPDRDAFEPDTCYLGWTLMLDGAQSEADILANFLFLEEFCVITHGTPSDAGISSLPGGSGPGPASGHAPADGKPEPEPAPAPAPAQSRVPLDAAIEATKSQPDDAASETPLINAEDRAERAGDQKTANASQRPASTLRVEPERVDRLINTVGELIINQAVISQKIAAAGLDADAELMGDLDDFQILAREIQEGVMAIRAQPVKPLFTRMQRIVREARDAVGKKVALATEGENVEIDKSLVERLAEPLTHMIRNAVDHGIEKPQARAAAGKPETGTIRLSAMHRSGHVVIEIADDGAGVNRPRVLQKAIEKGLVSEAANLSDDEIDNLLFEPGFSTATEVTSLSGRGVGMDVVKTAITTLGGRISISSSPGEGTVFSISMPLTLAVMDGMVVQVSDETMIVPLSSIVETIRPRPQDIRSIGRDGQLLSIRGSFVPIVSLASVLGFGAAAAPDDPVMVLVQSDRGEQVALAVNDISDPRQVVIKSLDANYRSIPGISAATILGDGRVALIVDTETILSRIRATAADMPRPKELSHG